MKNILFVVIISLFGFASQGQEKRNKNAKHEIAVKGNCEMCKKRIEKAAYSVPGVKSATWNAENQSLAIIVNEQKSSASLVEQAVVEVGHDTQNKKARDDDYANLHECCAYDRD